jgi:hypothetical protein
MTDLRTITTRAIHDAFALRGLEDGGGGFVRTSSPETYMDEGRLRLAREMLRHLPPGASLTGIGTLIDKLLPLVGSTLKQSVGDAPTEPDRIMFLS